MNHLIKGSLIDLDLSIYILHINIRPYHRCENRFLVKNCLL